jgi:hypothetical protein
MTTYTVSETSDSILVLANGSTVRAVFPYGTGLAKDAARRNADELAASLARQTAADERFRRFAAYREDEIVDFDDSFGL